MREMKEVLGVGCRGHVSTIHTFIKIVQEFIAEML